MDVHVAYEINYLQPAWCGLPLPCTVCNACTCTVYVYIKPDKSVKLIKKIINVSLESQVRFVAENECPLNEVLGINNFNYNYTPHNN